MSQIAGGIIDLNISQITNTSGGQLTGGENIIRAMLTQSIDVSNTLVGVIQVNTLDLGSVYCRSSFPSSYNKYKYL